jgi:4'-phosphopantetheinyl transferase
MSHAPLPSDVVRVTFWRYTDMAPDALLPFAAWMSVGESARLERFRFDRDREAFLASRVLLRQALADATGQLPASFRFSTDAHGIKPRLVAPADVQALHFSLTHTDGLVACALTWVGEVGIDAELWTRPTRVEALTPRVLSAREAAELEALAPDARQRRFLEYWTIKEAWLKAMGTGLRVPPTSVDVHTLEQDGQWVLRQFTDSPAHALALVHPRRTMEGGPVTVAVAPFAPYAPSRTP